jgi:O-antigen/teichoic acid export membrane protein
VGIVRNKIVAWLLGPEGMGLIALFNSAIKLVGDSTNLGLSMSAVREISEAYENEDNAKLHHSIKLIRSWSLLTALLGMFVCIAMSPWLDKWTFRWGDHTLHFVLLSPVVALMALTGGETAILKGTRRLKQLAVISVYNVLLSLFVVIPLYYIWGESAIVPTLFLLALIQMLLTIGYSYRLYPVKVSFNRMLLAEGLGMVGLGISFVLAGILGSGADFIIRSFLNREGSDIVGLYNAGYVMTVIYAGMVFSAMETDYFPRLSGVCKQVGGVPLLNDTVNKQIEVSLLLISPMLVAFLIGLPILLPLLYTGKFMPVLGMMQITVLAMYMRAIKLPISYLPLAKGDSGSYLLMEGIYDVVVVAFVLLGYRHWGLTGTGVALTAASVFDFVMLAIYMHFKYGYELSGQVVRYAVIQVPIGILAYGVTMVCHGVTYWLVGMLLALLSAIISLRILHAKTKLWESLKKKIKR